MNKPTGLHVVLFASGQLDNIGGIQRSYQILTDHLVREGWRVTVLGFAESLSGNAAPEQLAFPLNEKVNVQLLPFLIDDDKIFEYALEKVSALSADVVLVVNSSPRAIPFSAVARSLDVPLVYSMRGAPEFCLNYLWPCRKVFEVPFKAADAVHLLMPSYKEFMASDCQGKITTIPSQIAPAKEFALPAKPDFSGRYKVIYSGRLSFEKQLGFLVEAFSRLAGEFLEWDLQIVGSGPLAARLKQEVSDLGVSDRVEWLSVDNTEAMYQVYPQAHLKVLPSSYEGCPMALREAMAHGLPVIAYDNCSGSNEIIEHGHDGLLASSEDPVQGLADAMRQLMADSEARARIGKNGIEKAKKYLPEPINQAWEKLLLSAIERKKLSENRESKKRRDKDDKLLFDMVVSGRYPRAMLFSKDDELYKRYREEFLTVFGSRLFDDRYYLEKHLNVKWSGEDPLLHYISEGWKLGFNPSPEFDTKLYQDFYMEECDHGLCPLVHYYTKGAFKGAFPPQADREYFEKWPGRKPKEPYSILDDLSRPF